MKKKIGLLMGILMFLLVYGGLSYFESNDGTFNQTVNEENSSILSNENIQSQDEEKIYPFRDKELLDSHYKKHGSEFGNISKEEYLQGANKLINSSSPDLLTKYEKEDGDKIYYSKTTNEFLVLSKDGYIRTYFKPDEGIEYYNKQ